MQQCHKYNNATMSQNHKPTTEQLHACAHEMLDALKAIGKAFGQHNLLSTATDDERKAALCRIITAYNDHAAPIFERLEP